MAGVESVSVQVVRLREGAQLPRAMSALAAGMDLVAAPEDGRALEIAPGRRALVGTGLAIALPPGWEAQIRPRSGLALKHGITVLNSPGTVDADYRGEVKVLLVNHGDAPFVVAPGDRIAQLVVARVGQVALVEVESVEALGATDRGGGGYGSTGHA